MYTAIGASEISVNSNSNFTANTVQQALESLSVGVKYINPDDELMHPGDIQLRNGEFIAMDGNRNMQTIANQHLADNTILVADGIGFTGFGGGGAGGQPINLNNTQVRYADTITNTSISLQSSSRLSVTQDIEELKDQIQVLKDEIENLKMLLLEN